MVPVLLCSGCGNKLQLPYRRFVKSHAVEPYWPPLHEGLEWVCEVCGLHTSCKEDDIQWVAEDSVPPPPRDRAFWRVQIECATTGCPSEIIAHTQTFGCTSRRNLGLMIAMASPVLSCAEGHSVFAQSSYPEQVDFIEWAGTEEFLV